MIIFEAKMFSRIIFLSLTYVIFVIFKLFCVQKEREKRWDEKNQEAIAEAVKQLDAYDKVGASFRTLSTCYNTRY